MTRITKTPVRYLVMGAGNIAQQAVMPAFKHAPNSLLVGLVSSDLEKQTSLSRKYGVEYAGTYDDFEQLAKDSLAEAVYIALPNDMHQFASERAFKAGLHVLCEKPMAMSVEECKSMMSHAEATNKKLMIAYRLHFEDANQNAEQIANAGTLGEPRFFSGTLSYQVELGNIRTRSDTGGGALFDIGIYPVNAARHLFQSEPNEAFAFQIRQVDARSDQVEEMTAAVLRFPGQRTAVFTVSQGAAEVSSFRLVGTQGDLLVENAFKYDRALRHFLTLKGKTTAEKFKRQDQFAPLLVHFSRCIRDDLKPDPSGEEGLADVRVLSALRRSAEENRPIGLQEIL